MSKYEQTSPSYAGIPFWSWNHHLKPEKLREQIRHMKQQAMGGFIIHARKGLLTEYMGEEWLSCVGACIEEAERQGMEVWLYDENGWPSGFAGGALLSRPENHVWYLECEEQKTFDRQALAVFVADDGQYRRVRNVVEGCESYYVIHARQNVSYVDILNPAVVKQFIDLTHEVYYQKFSRYFGNTIQGFFTDEPQYFRWGQPWSPIVPQEFLDTYGYDVRDGLAALFYEFEGAAAFRNDFWKLMNKLLMEHYQKAIYDWCEAHHCKITGHTIEENSLSGQMMGSAGVMTFYEYEHIPGIDCLTSERDPELAARQCASVARQTGRQQVLTETFAACGWSATPMDLKRIAERQFVAGVNRINYHLYPYSVLGTRKRDYPPFFSVHNPWASALSGFNRYFENLGCLLGQSEDITPTLVIHPLRSAYGLYRFNDSTALAEYDEAFLRRVEQWKRDGLLYHFGDETLINKYGAVDGRQMIIGRRRYDYVILPELLSVDSTTAALLRRFLAGGGQLCVLGNPPRLADGRPSDAPLFTSTIRYEDIIQSQPVRLQPDDNATLQFNLMENDRGRFIYVLNDSEDKPASFRIDNQNLLEYHVLSGQYKSPAGQPDASGGMRINLQPGLSKILWFDQAHAGYTHQGKQHHVPLGRRWRIGRDTRNFFLLDQVTVVKDDGEILPRQTVMEAFNQLLKIRYDGVISLHYAFDIRDMPAELRLISEMGFESEITVNGQVVSIASRCEYDEDFMLFDIAELCRPGNNEVTVRRLFRQQKNVYDVLFDEAVTESLKNCMVYDTELENLYLTGPFGVYSRQGYEERQTNVLTASIGFSLGHMTDVVQGAHLIEAGFPFFAGAIRLSGQVEISALPASGKALLTTQFHGAMIHVYVNGLFVGSIFFDQTCEIGSCLKVGTNEILLELVTTGRNLYGPHHHPELELRCVSADEYGENATVESAVIQGKQYSFIRTGIEAAWITMDS